MVSATNLSHTTSTKLVSLQMPVLCFRKPSSSLASSRAASTSPTRAASASPVRYLPSPPVRHFSSPPMRQTPSPTTRYGTSPTTRHTPSPTTRHTASPTPRYGTSSTPRYGTSRYGSNYPVIKTTEEIERQIEDELANLNYEFSGSTAGYKLHDSRCAWL